MAERLEEHAENRRLDRCPICRYSLEGLPTVYRCPECGFEYDQETILLSDSRQFPFWVLVVIGVFFWFSGSPMTILRELSTQGTVMRHFWLHVVSSLAIIPYTVFAYMHVRYPPLVIVGPQGVHFRWLRERPRTYPWDEITGVQMGKILRECYLHHTKGVQSLRHYSLQKNSRALFCEAVGRRLNKQGATADSEKKVD